MAFVYCDMKVARIVVHSVVEECRQLWLFDFGLSKKIRKAATVSDSLETEFHQALKILSRENVLKNSMKN
jgi:hypothetical protein